MEHIADGLTIASIGTNATNAIATLAPYLALLIGIFLAFYVIAGLIELLKTDNTQETKK